MPLKYQLNKALLNVNCIADVLYGQNSMRRVYKIEPTNMYQNIGQVKNLC